MSAVATDAVVEQPGQPNDIVYAGRREGTTHAVDVFHLITPEGGVSERLTYKALKRRPMVGGVYTGVRFDGRVAYGLNDLRWQGPFTADPVAVAGWKARDHAFDRKIAASRAEKKHVDELTAMLLPARRLMHELRKRGQHEEAHALMDLILGQLYRPLNKEERGE